MPARHSLTEQMRRAWRAFHGAVSVLRSTLLLIWYRLLFAELVVGRNVRIGKGVTLRVVRGGRLVVGPGTMIEANCQLVAHGGLTIGPRSFIGAGTFIVAVENISIGADALIAAYATIRDHDHRTEPGLPFNSQCLVSAPIEIGENVWIGTKATILKGVTIGRDAVVAAHALVTEDVDPGSVVAGAPARLLRKIMGPESGAASDKSA